jgi:hypothetical protein
MDNNFRKSMGSALLILCLIWASSSVYGKTPVSDETGTTADDQAAPSATGEQEAQKYFTKKPQTQTAGKTSPDQVTMDDHYLAIHIGGFLSSDSYQWGATNHVSNPGRLQAGVTYKLGPLGQMADWALRADFIGYSFPEGNALNLAVLPMILFPDAGSAFPLYFGIGVGPGVFLQQIGNESTISFNYELVAGARVFDVIGNTGFFVETGLKNEIHLLSDGQFNGFFLSVGALFVF